MNIDPIPKLAPLYTMCGMAPVDLTGDNIYIIIDGGRSGGKSLSVGQILVLISRVYPTRILCTREIQKSMKDSVYQLLLDWIVKMGLRNEFIITLDSIINKYTGTDFAFIGMKAAIANNTLKGFERCGIVWYEEAQGATMESLRQLTPTIRSPGRKLIFTLNRKKTKDAVIEYFEPKAKVLRIYINYMDNQYCPETAIEEAEECKIIDYATYCHDWLGHPLADDINQVVLPYEWLSQFVDLHKKIGWTEEAKRIGGFDVADGTTEKHDKNSLACHSGPIVDHVEQWQLPHIWKSVNHINGQYNQLGFTDLWYDAAAMGAGPKSDFNRINESVTGPKLSYHVIPFHGAGSVGGKDKVYLKHGKHKITNGMMFQNFSAQSWWNLRLRAENSLRLLKGMKLDRPDYFLSFDSDIPDLDNILKELSQATFEKNSSGKIVVTKTPGTKEVEIDGKTKKVRSPNEADSIRMSFAADCRNGLKPGKSGLPKARLI